MSAGLDRRDGTGVDLKFNIGGPVVIIIHSNRTQPLRGKTGSESNQHSFKQAEFGPFAILHCKMNSSLLSQAS